MARVTSVIIAPDLAVALGKKSRSSAPFETGGILLGRELTDGTRLILSILGSGPNASATRASFVPDYEWQQAELERALLQSPDLSYLGDWHSHPAGRVVPSETDRRLLGSIRSEATSQCPDPVMIICGGIFSWTLRAFALDKRGSVSRVRLVAAPLGSDRDEEPF